MYFSIIFSFKPESQKRVLEYLQSPSRKYAVAVSCTDKEQLSDEFLAEFSVQLQLPTLSERPLRERMEMIKHLFQRGCADTETADRQRRFDDMPAFL